MSAAATTPAIERRVPPRARLARYALWQLRDFITERTLAIAIVFGLFVLMTREMMTGGSHAMIARGGTAALEFGARALADSVQYTWFITALVAVHGISANDRTSGRFRLLFAKPVSVPRFYAQAFLLHGLLYYVLAALFVAAFRASFPLAPVTMHNVAAIYLVSYLLVGGVCFLLSALWRFDWGTTIALAGTVTYLAAKLRQPAWLNVFPPFWKISDQADSLKYLEPLDWPPLGGAAAYGVACFLLGLLVLRRRQLAT